MNTTMRFGSVLSFNLRYVNNDAGRDPDNSFTATVEAYSKLKANHIEDIFSALAENNPTDKSLLTGEDRLTLAALLLGATRLYSATNRQEISAYLGRKVSQLLNKPHIESLPGNAEAEAKLKADGITDAIIVLNEGPAENLVATGKHGLALAAILLEASQLTTDENRQEVASYIGRKVSQFLNRPADKPLPSYDVSLFSQLFKADGKPIEFLQYRLQARQHKKV